MKEKKKKGGNQVEKAPQNKMRNLITKDGK